jgi:hypothetical protein
MPGQTYSGAWDSSAQSQTPGIVASVNASLPYSVFNSAALVNLVPSTAPAGLYRLTVAMVITTSFVTNTEVVLTFGWTDADQASTLTLTTAAKTAGTYLPASLGGSITSMANNELVFYSNGTAAITYTPSVTGTAATAGVAQLNITIERLV